MGIAWVFPGQGSQKVGLAAPWQPVLPAYPTSPVAGL